MVQPAAAVAAASVREPLAERQEPSILGHHQQQQQQQPLQELGSICDTYHKQQHLEVGVVVCLMRDVVMCDAGRAVMFGQWESEGRC